MDPCSFVRILVGSLALKFPVSSKPSLLSLQCFCKIKLKNFPTQKATIPLVNNQNQQGNQNPESSSLSNSLAACYSLDKTQIDNFLSRKKPKSLEIEVYSRDNGATCGLKDGKLLGKVTVPLDLRKTESRPCVMYNGWIDIGENKKGESTQFYLCVRVEPDSRYVFQFGGDPECSPQVFQVQGSVRQAVFTCKFSLRNPGDRNLVSMPYYSVFTNTTSSKTVLDNKRKQEMGEKASNKLKERRKDFRGPYTKIQRQGAPATQQQQQIQIHLHQQRIQHLQLVRQWQGWLQRLQQWRLQHRRWLQQRLLWIQKRDHLSQQQ